MSHAAAYDRIPEDTPVYVISVAAELAGLHPQTLRQYDRLGLVTPRRAGRYRLSDEGLNLIGIKRVLELSERVAELEARLAELADDSPSTALVVWRPPRRR